MNFLEKDLEQIIYETSNKELQDRGLFIYGKKKRQVKVGNYGILDLITVDRCRRPMSKETFLEINIFELKKDKIGISAFLQAVKYARGIQTYMYDRTETPFNIIITLIGRELDTEGSFCFLPSLFYTDNAEFEPSNNVVSLKFVTYNYVFEGISFTEHDGYKLSNQGF